MEERMRACLAQPEALSLVHRLGSRECRHWYRWRLQTSVFIVSESLACIEWSCRQCTSS
jgi:hypothetical protein